MYLIKIAVLVLGVSLLGGCAQTQLPYVWGGVSTRSQTAFYETDRWVDCGGGFVCPEVVQVRDSSVSLDVEFSWDESILNISWDPISGDTSFGFMFPWFTPPQEEE